MSRLAVAKLAKYYNGWKSSCGKCYVSSGTLNHTHALREKKIEAFEASCGDLQDISLLEDVLNKSVPQELNWAEN